MRHVFYALVFFVCAAVPVAAQVPLSAQALQPASSDIPALRHVTDVINSTPEAQQSLADFHQRKALGLLPAGKTSDDTIGDVRTFKVVNFETEELDDIDFEMVAAADRFQLWVETTATLDAAVLAELQQTLGETTPAGSVDPGRGIIANDEAIFGDPPNVDGDGKTDILLLDIRDGCSPGTGCFPIGGFFYSGDLSGGNQRDIIYLDAIVADNNLADLALTAAHEYQHLIFANYPKNLTPAIAESRFVNEGLSEWAEIANGYTQGRSIRHLGDVEEYNVPLLRFGGTDDTRREQDYQRARMWTTYLAQLVGLEIGRVTRDEAGGYASYRNLLDGLGLDLEAVLLDFHTANLLNDTSLGPNLGHMHSQHASLHALPANAYDGRLALESPLTSLTLNNGGVQYVEWVKVKDLDVHLDITSGADVLEGRLLKVQEGVASVEAFDPSAGTLSFSGAVDRVALIIAHIFPKQLNASLTMSASWQVDQVYESEEIVYDDGTVPVQQGENGGSVLDAYLLGEGSRQANRFEVPMGGILSQVSVAPYYESQFSGTEVSTDEPRNFRVHVWEDDGTGAPGAELLPPVEIMDDRLNGNGGVLVFKNIDLSEYADQLTDLPSPIYIGITNDGVDLNYLVMGVTEYPGNNEGDTPTSYLYLPQFSGGQGAWAAFADLQAGGEPVLQSRVLPIRATFLTPAAPVANEDPSEVPERVALHPNFPNPFNPTTTIRYDLPQATTVRLVVYDVLGREVAVLVDERQVAGGHQVAVNAGRWASGVYVYTIEAAGTRSTRRMVLLK